MATPQLTGFASVSGKGLETTTGGHGGDTVTADNQADLENYAGSDKPLVILLKGSITINPMGKEVSVNSNKTIMGVGGKSEIVKGGFNFMGVSNVIVRNLTIRDSYLEGDWIGKENDYDGFQMDNCHHIWIDHCHLTRLGDGMIDSRKGTTFLTVSWCVFSDHNKTFGIGWTSELTTEISIHHCWLRNTNQRNPSADNVKRCHMYNNFMQNITGYGNFARGGTNMIIENSVYEKVKDPHFYANGTLWVSGNIYRDISGKKTTRGDKPFEPKDFYDYELDPVEDVEKRLAECAGPQEDLSCADSKSAPIFPVMVQDHSLNNQGQNPTGLAVYSIQGTLLYQINSGLNRSLEWSAPSAGPYIIRTLMEKSPVQTRKIFLKKDSRPAL